MVQGTGLLLKDARINGHIRAIQGVARITFKEKYGDITAGLIVCGDSYPLEATIARRCLKLISSIDAPFLAAPELPARSYRNRVAQAGGEFWPPEEPDLKLYPRFKGVVYKIVKEESRLFGYNTVWALLPPVECLDEAFLNCSSI